MTKKQKSAHDVQVRHKTTMTRRSALEFCGTAVAGATLGGFLEIAAAQESEPSGQPLWRSRKVRRVVTGRNAEGKSCIINDEILDFTDPKIRLQKVWETGPGTPEGPLGKAPATEPRDILPSTSPKTDPAAGGTKAQVNSMPIGSGKGATAENRIGFHTTKTIDYLMILEGELTLITEVQETVLHTGDICIQRNTIHGWRNDGKVPCTFFTVLQEVG